jgi:hypothetical protein
MYGRASWPLTAFFSREGGLPVIPWYANFSTSVPWSPPSYAALLRDGDALQRRVAAASRVGHEEAMVEQPARA